MIWIVRWMQQMHMAVSALNDLWRDFTAQGKYGNQESCSSIFGYKTVIMHWLASGGHERAPDVGRGQIGQCLRYAAAANGEASHLGQSIPYNVPGIRADADGRTILLNLKRTRLVVAVRSFAGELKATG
jgi:hypothetical protein